MSRTYAAWQAGCERGHLPLLQATAAERASGALVSLARCTQRSVLVHWLLYDQHPWAEQHSDHAFGVLRLQFAWRPRVPRVRHRRPTPAQALFGDLLQRLGPGNTAWPPWQPATEPTRSGRKAKLLGEDLRQMRRLLEGCRLEQELRLPM
jgi:hypothetical protein